MYTFANRTITRTGPSSFRIKGEDASGYGMFQGSGRITEVKKPHVFKFKAMRESIKVGGTCCEEGGCN